MSAQGKRRITYQSAPADEPELVQLIRENRAAELQRLAELARLAGGGSNAST